MRLASTSLTAVATATALAATSTLTPFASAEESQPAPSVQSGYVTWSIKDSFLRYIQGPIAKDTVDATDGLETVKDGKGKITNLKFPVDTKNTSINAAGVGTIDLDGAVHFLGHKGHGPEGGYGLDVALSDFKVKVTEKEAIVTVDYLSKGSNPDGEPLEDRKGNDVEFAKLPLTTPIKPAANQSVTSTSEKGRLLQGGLDAFIFYEESNADTSAADFNIKFGGPVKPEEPNNPEQPGTPDNPTNPDKPSNPNEPNGSSLSTGGIIGIIVALLALIGGGAFLAHQAGFLK